MDTILSYPPPSHHGRELQPALLKWVSTVGLGGVFAFLLLRFFIGTMATGIDLQARELQDLKVAADAHHVAFAAHAERTEQQLEALSRYLRLICTNVARSREDQRDCNR